MKHSWGIRSAIKRVDMTYDKLLRLLKEERKQLDKRITEYLTMLVLEGDGRRLVLAVRRMGR